MLKSYTTGTFSNFLTYSLSCRVNGRKIFKLNFKKWDGGGMWFNDWLRLDRWWALVNAYLTLEFRKPGGISWLAVDMLDTQEAPRSTDWVISSYTVALPSAEIKQQELRFLRAETMECATVCRAVFTSFYAVHLSVWKLRFVYGIPVMTNCMEDSPPWEATSSLAS